MNVLLQRGFMASDGHALILGLSTRIWVMVGRARHLGQEGRDPSSGVIVKADGSAIQRGSCIQVQL